MTILSKLRNLVDESESSEDEETRYFHRRKRRRQRNAYTSAHAYVQRYCEAVEKGRGPTIQRQRVDWLQDMLELTPNQFRKCYRMTTDTFYAILRDIRDQLEVDEVMASRCSKGAIIPEVKLSMTLLWLGGARYLEMARWAGRCGTSTFYALMEQTLVNDGGLQLLSFYRP